MSVIKVGNIVISLRVYLMKLGSGTELLKRDMVMLIGLLSRSKVSGKVRTVV
jgi:hypothetical protein